MTISINVHSEHLRTPVQLWPPPPFYGPAQSAELLHARACIRKTAYRVSLEMKVQFLPGQPPILKGVIMFFEHFMRYLITCGIGINVFVIWFIIDSCTK